MTHWRSLKSAPRSRSIDGNATFTIVTSRSSMKIAVQLASRVHHLRSTAFRDYTAISSELESVATPRWCGYGHSPSLQRLCRRGEEVDQQLVDALSLVVMHPVRRVGQALDAVEVGHVVAVGLGEVGAEVGVTLTPDDQCRRRDGAKLRRSFLLGLFYRGAVVVDHSGCGPWL